jgi:serine/threonine protein kinase
VIKLGQRSRSRFTRDPRRGRGTAARFEREAQTIAALNHPNIVTVYSVEEAGGVLFLTMELVDGNPSREPDREGACRSRESLRSRFRWRRHQRRASKGSRIASQTLNVWSPQTGA